MVEHVVMDKDCKPSVTVLLVLVVQTAVLILTSAHLRPVLTVEHVVKDLEFKSSVTVLLVSLVLTV